MALAYSRQAGEVAESLTRDLVERLKSFNAVAIYTSIAAMERESRHLPIGDVYGYDAMVDFVGGLLTSMPAADVVRNINQPLQVQDLLEFDGLLRQLAGASSQAWLADLAEAPDQRNSEARFLLLQEQQFDRMSGYNQHVRRVVRDVVQPLEASSQGLLGFSALGALEASEAHTRSQEDGQTVAAATLAATVDRELPPAEQFGRLVMRYGGVIRADALTSVSERLSLPPDRTSALLEGLATPLNSQSVESLVSPNRLRRFPVIPLPDGTYVWARPYDFVHDALDWFDQLIVERELTRLREQLSKSRARTCEAIAVTRFAGVFGADRVEANVEYRVGDDDNWAETDATVDFVENALVVEAKGHRLTDPGRTGDAARVRSKFKELVVAPIGQAARARSAMLAGSDRRVRSRVRAAERVPSHVYRCVVLLDRVDPFIAQLQSRESLPEGFDDECDVWFVCLADLLMVTDVLNRPSELLAYIITRIEQTRVGSPRITMESDALGAWLKSREGVWPPREGNVYALGYSSDDINYFFTRQEMYERYPGEIVAPEPLSTGAPDVVIDCLDQAFQERTQGWERAALTALQVPPDDWRVLVRDLSRLNGPSTTRNQRKARERTLRGRAIGSQLRVVPSDASRIEVSEDGVVALHLPVLSQTTEAETI